MNDFSSKNREFLRIILSLIVDMILIYIDDIIINDLKMKKEPKDREPVMQGRIKFSPTRTMFVGFILLM